MTITITWFCPKQILFVADKFTYTIPNTILEPFLNGSKQITHRNMKKIVMKAEQTSPKIYKLSKNKGLIFGGLCALNDAIQKLNPRKNLTKQIVEKLKQHKEKTKWSCIIGSYEKNRCNCIEIIYTNGNVETDQITKRMNEGIRIDAFSPEIIELFKVKYAHLLLPSTTLEERIQVFKQFFCEITTLFKGLAGGKPQIAKIDKEGFQWVN